MNKLDKKRSFIIQFLYLVIWAGIIYVLLKYAMPLFMPFLLAFFISFLLRRPIRFITRKTPLPRALVAVVVLVFAYAVVGTLLTLLGIRFFSWLGRWAIGLPGYYQSTIEPALTQLSLTLEGFFSPPEGEVASVLSAVGEGLSSTVTTILNGISSLAVNAATSVASNLPWIVVSIVLTIIASFYFTIDYGKITENLLLQLPTAFKTRLFVIRDFVVNVLGRFLRAYLILMSITFAEVSVGLLILRVESPFLMAFVIAIVDILPVFGTGTVLIPWGVVSLIDGNYFLGIGLLVVYGAITVIRQTIEPRVVGKQIGLYPLLTLICMFIGARLFGFWGMLGFPVTLTLLIHLNRQGEISLFRTTRPGAGPTPSEGPLPPPEGPYG